MEYITQAKVYSEVYSFLNLLGQKYIEPLPKKLYNLIEEKREKTYNPIFDLTVPLYKQNISERAAAFICILHYNYWCTSEEEKHQIKKILEHNTEQAKKKYCDYEKMFNNNNPQKNKEKTIANNPNTNTDNTAIIVKNDDAIFKKIWKFIRNIFSR